MSEVAVSARLYEVVASALMAESVELASRWREQAPSVAPRADDGFVSEDTRRAAKLVESLACAVRNDPGCHDDVMRRGWEVGVDSHANGSSIHYLLKELGLLEALVLYACERTLAAEGPAAGGAVEGMALARRLHRFFRVLTLAAAKGFTQGYVEALRKRYQLMRHDLRNPLGTIRSAMSLMADETVPAATRDSPRIRQMVTRNATSLEQLIRDQLSDASTQVPAFALQEVSLEGIARAVRRDLREETSEAGCELVVSDSLPTARVDSTGLELALRAAVAGVAQAAERGSTIAVELDDVDEKHAALSVRYTARPGTSPADVERSLAFATEVLGRAGGSLRVEPGAVRLDLPVLEELDDLHQGDDVGRAR